jgi:hypothetical protein
MSFKKGYTHLVKSGSYNKWYIVHQVSMKQWVATVFTEAITEANIEVSHLGNSKRLFEDLEPITHIMASSDSLLRRYMYQILKYGEIRDWGNV